MDLIGLKASMSLISSIRSCCSFTLSLPAKPSHRGSSLRSQVRNCLKVITIS
ncbi:hypothetical protein DAI22_06g247000 [Oryza sativa Japonica Group]|nr:hypothetical protein DAI22_06g247000 [Oryza sativa Japonica Group]